MSQQVSAEMSQAQELKASGQQFCATMSPLLLAGCTPRGFHFPETTEAIGLHHVLANEEIATALATHFPEMRPAFSYLSKLLYNMDFEANNAFSKAPDLRSRAQWAAKVGSYLGNLYQVLRDNWRHNKLTSKDERIQTLKDLLKEPEGGGKP